MSDSDMKIKALAPWFGSKRTLAPRIVEELGPHRAYWEPFCGSMAVLLAKPSASMETVNDLHGDLVNLARVVQHEKAGPRLYRRLRRVMLDQDIHQECSNRIREYKPPQCLDVFASRASVQRELGVAFGGEDGFFLDKLDPDAGRNVPEPPIECGIFCSQAERLVDLAVRGTQIGGGE